MIVQNIVIPSSKSNDNIQDRIESNPQTHSYLSNIKKDFKNDKSVSIESLEETMKHENQDEMIERDENLKLDRHLNFQIKKEIKNMMLILSPLILLKILISQPLYTITQVLQAQNNQAKTNFGAESQKNNFSTNLNIVLLLRFLIDIFHYLFIGSIALSIYKNYLYNKDKDFSEKNVIKKDQEKNEETFFKKYQKQFKTLMCLLIILFEDIIIERFVHGKVFQIEIQDIFQIVYEQKLWGKIFNLLVFIFYKAHDGQKSSIEFIALFQFDVLSNVLGSVGNLNFKNDEDIHFWNHNQLGFAKIIFAFQIMNISYILCTSQIQKKLIQNEKKRDDLVTLNQSINLIGHLNKLTSPENTQPDLEYIGGFTRIIFKDSLSEHKESQKQKKSFVHKKIDNNICNFFIQILKSMMQNLIIFIEKSNENFDESILKESDLKAQMENNQIQYIPKDFNCHLQQDISPSPQEEDQQFSDFKQLMENSDQSSVRNLQNYLKELKSSGQYEGVEMSQFINKKTSTFIKLRCINENQRFKVIHFQIYKKEMKKKDDRKNQNIQISSQIGLSQISISPQNYFNKLKKQNQINDTQNNQLKANNNFSFSFNQKVQKSIQEESSKQSGQLESSEAREEEKQQNERRLSFKQRTFSHADIVQLMQNQQLNKDAKFVSHHRQSVDVQRQSLGLQRSFSFGSTDFNEILPIIKKSENVQDDKILQMNQKNAQMKSQDKKDQKETTIEKEKIQKNAKKKLFKKLNKIDDQLDINSLLHDSQIDRVIKRSQNVESDEKLNVKKEKKSDQSNSEIKKQKIVRQKSENGKPNLDWQKNLADQIQSAKQSGQISNIVSQYNGNSIPSFSNISGFDIKSKMDDDNQHNILKKAKSQFDFQNMIKHQDEKKIDQLQKLCENLPKGKLQKQVKDELEQVKVSFENNDKQKRNKKSMVIPNFNFQESQESSQIPSSAFKDSVQSLSISNFKKGSGGILKNQANKKKGTKSDTLKKLIDHYENKIEQKQTALEFFKKKVKDLENSLESNKIFLNMAVHDMRNPTNQMEFLVSQTVIQLKELKERLSEKLEQLNYMINQQNQQRMLNLNQESQNQLQILKQDQQFQQFQRNKQRVNKTLKQQIEKQQFQDLDNHQIQRRKSIQILRQSEQFNLSIQENKNNRMQIKINEKFKKIQEKQIQQDQNKLIDKKNLNFKMKKISKSIDYKNKKSLFEILIRKSNSQQKYRKDKNSISDMKYQLFKQVELYKKELIDDSKYVVQSIKNKIDHINNQKNEFYNRINYLDKKNFSLNILKKEMIQNSSQNDKNKEEGNQAFNFMKMVKNNIFSIKSIQDISESKFSQNLDQEPKIMKKKVKNLHLSFDASLLQQNINHNQNHLKVDARVNEIEIVFEQIKIEGNQIDSRQNNQSQIQGIVNFMQEYIQDLSSTIGNLENCKFSSVMLLNLINDMMDLAKSEKMKFELNSEFFDLTNTIQRAFENLSYFGQQKNIMPKLIVDSEIKPFFQNLKGDEGRFSQILLNFLSNAFKFSSQNGSITLELCQADDQIFCQKKYNNIQLLMKNNNQILHSENNQNISPSQQKYLQEQQLIGSQIISENNEQQISENDLDDGYEEYYISFQMKIRDTGMGISRENLGKLFLNFGKLADPSGCNKTGTGLGLSICKHLIEKMGGKVKVESEGIGKGTTFIIKMQAISRVQESVYSESQNLMNMSQLMPSLTPIRNKEISDILKEQNEALQKAQSHSQHGKISGILDKLCVSAQKALHKDYMNQNSNLALKNNQSFEEKQREQIPKSPQRKKSILLDPNTQLSIADAIRQLKVLIINDEFFILQMLKMMVKKVNIEDIDIAQNGFDGFNMVIQKQYDFIICDLNMPVMDGFECIEKIKDHYDNSNQFFKQQKNLNFCPFLIACSAFITLDIEAKAYQSGFELVVESPLTISVLTDQIIVKSLEKKAMIKKQIEIEQFKDKKEQANKSESSQEIDIDEQKKKIQILIEKLDNKLRISQQKNLQKKNSGHLHASLNDLDLISDEESSKSIESSIQIDDQDNGQLKNKISLNKQSLGKISEVDEISANKIIEREENDYQQQQFSQNYSGESQGNTPVSFDNHYMNSYIQQDSQKVMNEQNFDLAANTFKNYKQNIFFKNQENQNVIFQNNSFTSMASQNNIVQTPIFNVKKQIKRMDSKQLIRSGVRKSEDSQNVDHSDNNNQEYQI